MRRRIGSLLLCVPLLLARVPAASPAARAPIVRSRVEPAEVVVGQEQRLVVDVLVPTWLLGAPGLPEISMPGVVVTRSGEVGVNLTESVDGETWSGVSNEYALFTQRPGRFAIPPDRVSIRYSVEGRPETAEVAIPALSFVARRVPGLSRDEHVLAASALELQEEIEPTARDLRVGDSIRRTLRLEAEETRAMLLPQLATRPTDGLAAYPDTPQLADRPGQRGRPSVAERLESTSFILERPGRFTLPAVEVRWWNVSKQRLEIARAPGVSFDVAPNLQRATGGRGKGGALMPWGLGLLLLAAVTLGAVRREVLWSVGRRVTARLERMRHSERSHFGALVRATRQGEPRAVLRALFAWLDRRARLDETATVAGFIAACDAEDLRRETEALQASVYAEGARREAASRAWSGAGLRRAAVEARRRAARHDGVKALPRLNPGAGSSRS